jgi:2-polyprenyl-6-methoxyphenol hydroxylase-like FAD-dependent oxidoreductase
MTQAEAANLKVVVNGGSIGGLCAGVALRGIGADVQVYEEHPGPMDTRGAGIVVQGDLTNLLRAHHAPELPTTGCSIRRYLDSAGGEGRTETCAAAVHFVGSHLYHFASDISGQPLSYGREVVWDRAK